MRIKALEAIRMTCPDTGEFIGMEADDIKTVSAKAGLLACGAGWAEDADGQVPTGDRDLQPKQIDVNGTIITAKASQS